MRPLIRAGVCVALALSATSAMADPAEVTVRKTDAGTYIADAKGMALYTYAQDNTPGKSVCFKECAVAWPPLLAPAGAAPQGAFTLVDRGEGVSQWAWNGKPLYAYARDKYPAIALGDRVGNAWSVAFAPVKMPPGLAVRALFAGRTLTDHRGYVLHVNAAETPEKPACDRDCRKLWTPLAAPQAAKAVGDFTVAKQADGSPQWAWRGQRLYLDATATKPGAIARAATGTWKPAVLEAAPALPTWVTVQNSDMGEIYADARGMTLYTFTGDMKKTRELVCRGGCIDDFWKPVPATAEDKPAGEWTPIATPEGGWRWAYKGNAVYVHTRDKFPGAIGGDKWASGVGGGGGGFVPIVMRRDYEED